MELHKPAALLDRIGGCAAPFLDSKVHHTFEHGPAESGLDSMAKQHAAAAFQTKLNSLLYGNEAADIQQQQGQKGKHERLRLQ
jgi:hypothetical protein